MNKLYFVLISILLSQVSFAWSPLFNYYNWYNITVPNWNYTYNGISQYNVSVSYVLINLPIGSGNINTYAVQGFTSGGALLGNIKYTPVSVYGINPTIPNNNFVLIPRFVNGTAWNKVSIFYNPVSTILIGDVCNNLFYNTFYSTLTQVQANTKCRAYSFTSGASSNSLTQLNFTFNKGILNGSQSMIILANRSLTATNYIINFFPDAYHTYILENNTNNANQISAASYLFNVANPLISSNSLKSTNANIIFTKTDNIGFETFLQIASPQFEEGNIIANQTAGNIINPASLSGTKSEATGFSPCFTCSIFGVSPNVKFSVNTMNTIAFEFMPAFTTNYIITNSFANSGASLTPNAPQGWFYDFQNRLPITNILWQYNFLTFARCDVGNCNNMILNTPNTLMFGAANVPFALLNIPHYAGMGSVCQNLYLRDYNAITTTDLGSIPYYLNNENGSTCQLLIPNKTQAPFSATYNSFYVYYNSKSGLYGDFSNTQILNNWQLGAGQSFNVLAYNTMATSTNVPMVINLNQPLVTNSFISFQVVGGASTPIGLFYDGQVYVDGHAKVYDTQSSFYKTNETSILITPSCCTNPEMYTRNLHLYQTAGNAWEENNALVVDSGLTSSYSIGEVNVLLQNPVKAKAVFLYANKSTFQPIQFITTTQPQPATANSLNFTTIPQIVNQTTTLSILPNFSLPLFVVVILGIIFVLLLATTFGSETHENFGFTIGIIALWLFGFWGIQYLVLAMIVTIIFLIYEFRSGIIR